jgi:tetratricopeptide (TPR) repeat protein
MQTDWLVQQFSQFGRVLAIILGLKKRQEYRASLEAIEEALNTLLDLDLEKLRDVSPAELFHRLTIAETMMIGREKVLFAATLLNEAGDVYMAQDQTEESTTCYVQALQLLLELITTDDLVSLPNHTPTVEDMLAKIDPEALPLETWHAAMRYFEKVGAYAQAEDVLFQMLDTVSDDPETISDLIAIGDLFYVRIQQQSDVALIAGNLARSEIATGILDLHNYLSGEKE